MGGLGAQGRLSALSFRQSFLLWVDGVLAAYSSPVTALCRCLVGLDFRGRRPPYIQLLQLQRSDLFVGFNQAVADLNHSLEGKIGLLQ